MAKAILINAEVDILCLGSSIEAILRRKGQLTVGGIREALLTTDLGNGEYIDASVEEIQEVLEVWLVPDGDVVQVDKNSFQAPEPENETTYYSTYGDR